ncbi:spore wall protein 2 [Colletotrichum higginsianum]|nr:spore wall protein 2 [Colletotrichum higginsianum]
MASMMPTFLAKWSSHALAGDLALAGQRRLEHAAAAVAAGVGPLGELVTHHALEDVLLVVPVVEDVAVEGVEDGGGDHEAVDAHPQAVGEGDEGEADDEAREQRGEEDDEALGGEQVEEEPEDPDEEGVGGRAEVGQPVGDGGEDEGDEEEVRQAEEEVGDEQRRGAVQAVVVLLDVLAAVLEEGRDVGDGHEGHEGAAEEDGVGQRDDGGLVRREAHPHGAHHEGEARVHGEADAVGDDVAVALDEAAVQERDDEACEVRLRLVVVGGGDDGGGAVTVAPDVGDGHAQVLGRGRLVPGGAHGLEARGGLALVADEVGVDELEHVLGRVHLQRDGHAQGLVVGNDAVDGAEVVGAAGGEEEELVEEVEGGRRGLVDGRDNDELGVVANDLVAGGRVEAAGGLVEEQDLGARDELAGDADAPLLAARDALADGRADDGVGLVLEAEGGQQAVDAGDALGGGQGGGGEARGEEQGLADGQGADEGVLLLDEAADASEVGARGRRAVDEDGAADGRRVGRAAGEEVEERRLAAARGAHEGADLAWKGTCVG